MIVPTATYGPTFWFCVHVVQQSQCHLTCAALWKKSNLLRPAWILDFSRNFVFILQTAPQKRNIKDARCSPASCCTTAMRTFQGAYAFSDV